jgi:hypothetical protein
LELKCRTFSQWFYIRVIPHIVIHWAALTFLNGDSILIEDAESLKFLTNAGQWAVNASEADCSPMESVADDELSAQAGMVLRRLQLGNLNYDLPERRLLENNFQIKDFPEPTIRLRPVPLPILKRSQTDAQPPRQRFIAYHELAPIFSQHFRQWRMVFLAGWRIHPYSLDHQMAKGVQKPPLLPMFYGVY